MLFGARISGRQLSHLCRRLSIALESGVDVRRVMEREVGAASLPALRDRLQTLHDAVRRGDSISEGLAETGDYFPELFREMVAVGEEAGRLPHVLRDLAEHYEHQGELRRIFLAAITWPMLQLGAAIGIVGFMILIMGVIGNGSVDPLGFGLVGLSGLVVYLMNIAAIAAGVFFVVRSIARQAPWTRPLQDLLLRLPGIGHPLETLALARLAWSLDVTLASGMDILKAVPLSIRATRNSRYLQHSDAIVLEMRRGRPLDEAMVDAGVFRAEFVDTVHAGEEAGRLPEALGTLAIRYRDEARHALKTLTVVGGFAVWALVAMLIIAMIFRLAGFYINTINEAVQGV